MPYEYLATRASSLYTSQVATFSGMTITSTSQVQGGAGQLTNLNRLVSSSTVQQTISWYSVSPLAASGSFTTLTSTSTSTTSSLYTGSAITVGSGKNVLLQGATLSSSYAAGLTVVNVQDAEFGSISLTTFDPYHGSVRLETFYTSNTFLAGTSISTFTYSTFAGAGISNATVTILSSSFGSDDSSATYQNSSQQIVGDTLFETRANTTVSKVGARTSTFLLLNQTYIPGDTNHLTYVYGTVQYQNSSSGSTTGSTTFSSAWKSTFQGRTGTTTQTTTASNFTTTSSTRSSTFPTSDTAGTQSTFSVDTFTTVTQIASTITQTTYATAVLTSPMILDTVVEIGSNDWVWTISTTGTGAMTSMGTSTSGTVTFSGSLVTSINTTTSTYSSTGSSIGLSSFTVTSFFTSRFTTTSSTSSTSSSTYRLAGPTSVAATLSFTQTSRTLTVSYISTTTATISWTGTSSLTVLSATISVAGNTWAATVTLLLTSTNLSNTFATNFTTTQVSAVAFGQAAFSSSRSTSSSFAGNSSSITTSVSLQNGASPLGKVLSAYALEVSQTTPVPRYTDVTVKDGFQAGTSLGRDQTVGTNVTAGVSLPMVNPCSSVWPGGPVTPVMATGIQTIGVSTTYQSSDSAFTVTTSTTTIAPGTTTVAASVPVGLAGSFVETLINTKSSTQFGGFGWESTQSASTLTGTSGVHRVTVLDSTNGTVTTEISWGATNSSFALSRGAAIAMEPIPQVSSTTSTNLPQLAGPYLDFPAFPST